MALFGEKYGDEVRVLSMGRRATTASYSVELCGGTHVARARRHPAVQDRLAKARSPSGVRRIEALTGEAARLWLTDREDRLKEAAAALKASPEEVPARVAALLDERRRLERELAEAKKALALGGGGKAEAAGAGADRRPQLHRPGARRPRPQGAARPGRRGQARVGSGVVALVAVNDGRATVAVGVTDDLVGQSTPSIWSARRSRRSAGRAAAAGPTWPRAAGPDGSKAEAALQAVRDALAST